MITTRTIARTAVTAGFLAVLLLAPAARAQVCGDVNGDNKITTTDAQKVLKAAVGQPVALVCQDQCAALETRIEALEKLLEHVTIDGNNLVLTGMNFQVVSGSGKTNGSVNGKGNIIIGYDEDDGSDDKTGSHNLVIGRDHTYTSFGGIVAGEDNEIDGDSAAILGGTGNIVEDNGTQAVIVAGQDNRAQQETSVILGGEQNRSSGRSCSIAGGTQNRCTALSSAISGGGGNLVTGAGSVIGGTTNRTLGSNFGWQAGSLGPVF